LSSRPASAKALRQSKMRRTRSSWVTGSVGAVCAFGEGVPIIRHHGSWPSRASAGSPALLGSSRAHVEGAICPAYRETAWRTGQRSRFVRHGQRDDPIREAAATDAFSSRAGFGGSIASRQSARTTPARLVPGHGSHPRYDQALCRMPLLVCGARCRNQVIWLTGPHPARKSEAGLLPNLDRLHRGGKHDSRRQV
jgi:hypothetical protein